MIRTLKWVLILLLLTIVGVVILDMTISQQAKPDIYKTVQKVPPKKAALVLGTAKYMVGGGKNYF